MSTTIPNKFNGTPSLDALKVDTITQWYHGAMGDLDKCGDMDDAYYYSGLVDGLHSSLRLLYSEPETTVAVTVAAKSHPKLKTAALIVAGVTVYVIWKKRAQIKETIEKF